MPRPLTKNEHVELHGKLRTQFIRHGHSQSKAYKMADDFLFQKTGECFHSPARNSHGNLNAAAGYRTSRCHTEESVREIKPQRGYDRVLQEGNGYHNGLGPSPPSGHGGRDADSIKSPGRSSHVYTTEELEAIEKDIYETWVKRGVSPDYARQQAKIWFNRYAGKNVCSSGTPGSSRSDRLLTQDDLSGMGDTLNGRDGCYSRTPGPSHPGFMHGSCSEQPWPAGREYPVFNEYFTEKLTASSGSSQGYSFCKENRYGMPPFHARHERFNPKDAHCSFPSHFSAPRKYTANERSMGDFSSFNFTCSLNGNFNSYDNLSYWDARNEPWYNPRFNSNWPPTGSSGIKPSEDLYTTLHISYSASAEDIKHAHRKLSLMYHPDREKGNPSAKKAATERMARINQAYDVLRDDETRAFYDRTGLIATST